MDSGFPIKCAPTSSSDVTICSDTVIPSVGCVATPYVGSHFEGLLPVPEKLTQKIIRLEFVEMRDLMPETWLMEEDSGRTHCPFPERELLWSQIFFSGFSALQLWWGYCRGHIRLWCGVDVVSGNHHQVCEGFSRAGMGSI